MTKEQTKWLKGITIILMLIHHLFTWGGASYKVIIPITLPKGYDIPQFIGVFGKLCVTIYLFLSGYGFACKYMGKKIKGNQIIQSVWSVYRKYLLSFGIFFIIGLLLGKRKFEFKEWFLNLISYDTTYNKECWFLFIYILILFIILPVLCTVQTKFSWKIRIVMSFAVICMGYGMRAMFTIGGQDEFMKTQFYFNCYYFLLSQFSFVLGWICKERNIIEMLKDKIRGWRIIAVIVMVVVLKVYCPGGMLIDSILTPFFIVCCLKGMNKINKIDKVLMALGMLSTYMWMTHSFYNIYYFDKIIYAFRYPLIITGVLIIISATTAKMLEWLEYNMIQQIKGRHIG